MEDENFDVPTNVCMYFYKTIRLTKSKKKKKKFDTPKRD